MRIDGVRYIEIMPSRHLVAVSGRLGEFIRVFYPNYGPVDILGMDGGGHPLGLTKGQIDMVLTLLKADPSFAKRMAQRVGSGCIRLHLPEA